jgi:hypothetical protein
LTAAGRATLFSHNISPLLPLVRVKTPHSFPFLRWLVFCAICIFAKSSCQKLIAALYLLLIPVYEFVPFFKTQISDVNIKSTTEHCYWHDLSMPPLAGFNFSLPSGR